MNVVQDLYYKSEVNEALKVQKFQEMEKTLFVNICVKATKEKRSISILLALNKKLDSMPRVIEKAANVPQSIDFLRLCVAI